MNHPFKVGQNYLIRSIPYHAIGTVKNIFDNFLELENACFLADSGDFESCLSTGKVSIKFNTGTHYIALPAISDAFPWIHDVPPASS